MTEPTQDRLLHHTTRRRIAYRAAQVRPSVLERRVIHPGVNNGNPKRLRRTVWDDKQKAAAVDEIAAKVRARLGMRAVTKQPAAN